MTPAVPRRATAAALFDDDAIAAGYAHDRPAVHPQLMERLRACPAWTAPVRRAVDAGCGAGASTAALLSMASSVLGVDPAARMVRAARRTVRTGAFAVARAEAIPCAAGSVDLIGAAGALDYADLGAFVRDADRVLTPGGLVAVSNYGFGRPTGAGSASDWPARFGTRWPRPASEHVDASSFAGGPFEVVLDQRFVVTVPMTRDAYLAYVMTDTAVAQAVADGTPAEEIRAWCAAALPGGDAAERTVAFDCSLVVLQR